MKRIFATTLSAMALLMAPAAQAQDYPARNIRILVPFAPGGIADGSARFVGNHLSEIWGKSVVVDNRPGGGSIIAITAVVKAPSDGYTLLHANTTISRPTPASTRSCRTTRSAIWCRSPWWLSRRA